MKPISIIATAAALLAGGPLQAHEQVSAAPSAASSPSSADAEAPRKMLVEIYRIAPGQHEAFMRFIALFDEANRLAGLPPRQLYVHRDGAGFDFMLIQPADIPQGKEAALEAAYAKLKTPSGPNFFIAIRRYIAEHSDNFVTGPTTAADWLRNLEESRSGSDR